MKCPSVVCQAENGEREARLIVMGGFFTVTPSRAANMFGDVEALVGLHFHDNVTITLSQGAVKPWKNPRLYYLVFRMAYRMLRHGMTPVEAIGP